MVSTVCLTIFEADGCLFPRSLSIISLKTDLLASGRNSASRVDSEWSSAPFLINSRSNTVQWHPTGACDCKYSASLEATVRPPDPHIREMVMAGLATDGLPPPEAR